MVDLEYQRFEIQDSSEADGFHSGSYVHNDCAFFNITKADVGAQNFFDAYFTDRSLNIRIVLEYVEQNQVQEVIGTIGTKTSSTSCIDFFALRAYYTITGSIIRLLTNEITSCSDLVLSDDMII